MQDAHPEIEVVMQCPGAVLSAAFSNARPKKLGTQRRARCPHPGLLRPLDGHCPPLASPSPAQPSGWACPQQPPCPRGAVGGVPGTQGRVGWTRGGGGQVLGGRPTLLEVEKHVLSLALRLNPRARPWTHFFRSELSVLGDAHHSHGGLLRAQGGGHHQGQQLAAPAPVCQGKRTRSRPVPG